MHSEDEDENPFILKFTDEAVIRYQKSTKSQNQYVLAHRKWIEKKHNNNLTPKEPYVKNAAEAFRCQELIDWASDQVNIEPFIKYMEDYYSISAELFTSDPDFIQIFGSMYRYVKTLFPDYEWVKSYFIDEF
jgi:hypothetical protein